MKTFLFFLTFVLSTSLYAQNAQMLQDDINNVKIINADTANQYTTFCPTSGTFSYTNEATILAQYLDKTFQVVKTNFNSDNFNNQRNKTFDFLNEKFNYFEQRCLSISKEELAEVMKEQENIEFATEYFQRNYQMLYKIVYPYVKTLKMLDKHKMFYKHDVPVRKLSDNTFASTEQLDAEREIVDAICNWVLVKDHFINTFEYLKKCDNQRLWLESVTGMEFIDGADVAEFNSFRDYSVALDNAIAQINN